MNRIKLTRTTVFRLALSYAGIYCLLAAVCLGILYFSVSSALDSQIDAGLRAESTALQSVYSHRGLAALQSVIKARSTPEQIASSNASDSGPRQYLLVSPRYKVLAGSLDAWPLNKSSESAPTWATSEMTVHRPSPGLDQDDRQYRLRSLSVTLPGGYHMLIGQALDETDELRQSILGLTLAAILVTVLAGIIGGFLVGRSVLYKIQRVTEAADTIMAGDFSERIPVSPGGDEFAILSLKLNTMLDRIEQLLHGMQAVSANVAHDLRSPLTRLRNRLELLLRDDSHTAGWRENVSDAVKDADGLIRTFNAMLSIAQLESGSHRAASEVVDVGQLLADMEDLFGAPASEQGLALHISGPDNLAVQGNRHLLAQALSNLLDNAIKYTPSGGNIHLAAKREGNNIVIIVADDGPGIPADQRSRMMERFTRLDTSRSQPGNGLGLSLVKAIILHHGGSLELEDNEPGLRACITLQAAVGS